MCRMCEEPERAGKQYLNEVLDRIREYGWCVQSVLGTETRPPWAYTAGLTAQSLPELVVTGVLPHLAAHVLNTTADQMLLSGPPEPGQRWSLPGLPPLEAVPVSMPTAHLHTAVSCYGTEIQAVQVVHADGFGQFPWSPEYNCGQGGQPVLGVRHD